MGRNLKLLTVIFSLTLLYGVYYWGIPAVINLPERVELIEQNIFDQYGFKTDLKNPSLKMGFLPSAKLKAENFSILNDDNSKAFEIINANLDIKLLPLILKKISIKNFSAQNICINLIFDKDSKFKLGQYNIDNIQKSPFKLQNLTVHINEYNINLDDKLQNKKIVLNGQYFNIENFIFNKHIDISTVAKLNTGSKISQIKTDLNIKLPLNNITDNQLYIDGHIINLDLSEFSAYAKSLSNNQIKSLNGIINFVAKTSNDKEKRVTTKLVADKLGIYKDNIPASIYADSKIEINTDLNTINNGIKINEAKISADNIHASVKGNVTKLDSKIPHLDLKIGIDDSRAENILHILPGESNLIPDIDLLLLKQTGFWGNVSGNLEVKGKADLPNVFGNILVNDAYMVKPIANAQKAVIKLLFTGDKLDLDVNVPTSSTQTVWVKGPINLNKEKTADLKITSTDNVDLKTAQIVLNPLHKILHFDLGPVPIMDIKGKGGINLHVIGTRQNPHGWGQFHFTDTTASFLDIHNLVLNNASGTLDFDNQNTLFQTKTAMLNNKPVSVKGTCSLLGILNFNVIANNQDLSKLLKTVQTSPMLEDIQKLLSPIENATGNADFKLNLTGQVKDVNDVVFNKNVFANGSIKLNSNKIKIKDLPYILTSGNINFNNLDADFDLNSSVNSSKLKIIGKIKDNIGNVKVSSDKFNAKDAAQALSIPYVQDISTINSSFTANYNGKIDDIEFDKLSIKGKIHSNKNSKSIIIVNDSTFELKNSSLRLPSLTGTFENSPFNINLNGTKIFSDDRNINGEFVISSFDLKLLNEFKNLIKTESSAQLNDIEFLEGKTDLKGRIRNNNLNVYSVLNNISFKYKPQNVKITINNGNLLLRNNLLNLNKINAKIGSMPVFIEGKIANIKNNPDFNLYINAKPSQDFFDGFINSNSVYPIKLKGDTLFTTKLNGTLNKLSAKSILNIEENSNLYYMGMSLGDVENSVKIVVDSIFYPNKVIINNLQYDKIINSQNNKPFINNQLNASGTLNLLADNNVGFNNFKIKTQTPTDAKIFNIIFRKPFMKQGVFTSDLILNGTSLNPKINGKFNISSVDVPFFDSTITDIDLNFKNDKVYISSKGTVVTNDVLLDAIMKNKLTPPYIVENVKIKVADLNVNKITDTIRDMEAESVRNPQTVSSVPFDISEVIIENGEIIADTIQVRNINANNFNSNFSINDKNILNVDKFKFNIAEGSVIGNLKYNLTDKNSNLNINLHKANAAIMSEALFDLKGQIFGSVDGNFTLACNGSSNENCFKTLSGNGSFKVADGRMPKLGSLEYLLKAGNIFKGGITGLSINSIIDLITPLKTGNFESISGDMHIVDGIVDKINIYSSGNDLNMYMTGNYNILTSVADMIILGSLSKNITTVFGKIKNASLNTLFNTIPGINNSDEKLLKQTEISKIPNIQNATDIYRIFAVDINGDINGENYVKSFKWVK